MVALQHSEPLLRGPVPVTLALSPAWPSLLTRCPSLGGRSVWPQAQGLSTGSRGPWGIQVTPLGSSESLCLTPRVQPEGQQMRSLAASKSSALLAQNPLNYHLHFSRSPW